MSAASFDYGRFLYHEKINRDDALEIMVDYLGVDPEDSMKEIGSTQGCHARFQFLDRVYTQQLYDAG